MGKKKQKQHNKSKNRNGTNAKKQIGLKENVRVVHSDENNPHDG